MFSVLINLLKAQRKGPTSTGRLLSTILLGLTGIARCARKGTKRIEVVFLQKKKPNESATWRDFVSNDTGKYCAIFLLFLDNLVMYVL
jgi:hypothetical protein